ncbi:TonB-dependent siderophore receptor [Shewanella psychrophila]|uniref:TonB-dependent siderophore receptor n=1 Tax=Shewanella psychrophila TaxID=225848 RepID=A0A1S6HJP9_9GAMM|nr:TonB-dependent receptor [Shewanella psychrophila]AQS35740.1 TonB-dependent siderophore receptor [Shewanella psychrophila]
MFKLSTTSIAVMAAMTIIPAQAHEKGSGEIERISVTGTKSVISSHGSAMKMETSQLDTAGTVAVYDSSLMEAQKAQTLGDVLKNDASVSAGNTRRNRERFYMRGFVLEPDQSYLRDGQFHLSRYSQPIELYERIEVLKGTGALLYGKSTPAGLINLVTKKADKDEFKFSIQHEFGSFGHSKSTLDVAGALNESGTIRARSILSKSHKDGWREYKDGSKAESERFVGALMLEGDISDDTTITFNYDKTDDDGKLDMGALHLKNKKTGEHELIGKRGYIWDMPWAKRKSDVENIGFTVNSNLSDDWSFNTGVNKQIHERRTLESMYGKVQGVDLEKKQYSLRGRDTFEKFAVLTGYFDLKGEFDTGGINHRMVIGTNFIDYSRTGKQMSMKIKNKVSWDAPAIINRPDELDYRNGKDMAKLARKSYGVYVQDQIELNDQWHVIAGVRLDREETDTSTQNNILPKLGVIYHPTDNTSIYTTYSESFEPKDPIMNSDDVNYGKSLDAERGESFEIGAKGEFLDGALYLSTALFNIEQNNKVITDKTGKHPETTQAGSVRHRGIEFSAEGQLTNDLSLLTSMMYIDAKIIKDPRFEGNLSRDVPKFSASTWLSYSLTDDTKLSAGAVYVGERYGDPANEFLKDGYVKVDLGLSHTVNLGSDHAAIVRFTVDNLFDADYLKGGCTNNANFGDGRAFKASLEYKF